MQCERWQGGAKIKEIRESSGANIKAYQSCAPQVSAIPDFGLKGMSSYSYLFIISRAQTEW